MSTGFYLNHNNLNDMTTNITISFSDIIEHFWFFRKSDIEIDKDNLQHYSPFPENYTEQDYQKDRDKLKKFYSKRQVNITDGSIEDNLTDEEKIEKKNLKRRIAEYPSRDVKPFKVGEIIKTRPLMLVESENDLELVYHRHLEERLANNAFANVIYFISDEIQLVQKWINWIEENNRNWDKKDMLLRYSDLLTAKLKEHRSQQQTEAAIEISDPTGKAGNMAQQVLAMHYIFEYMQVRGIDQTNKAKFIQFLTGGDYSNIYKSVRNPFISKNKLFRFDDLKIIRPYFEKLGISNIVKMINNQLEQPR